jgi:hypothetical protein
MNMQISSSRRATLVWLLVLGLAVGLPSGEVSASEAPEGLAAKDPFQLIAADYAEGKLTIDEKAHLQLQVIYTPNDLPEKYQTVSPDELLDSRGATPALIEIWQDWDQLSNRTRELAASMAIHPERELSIVSPSGFFTLHYDTSGTHAVAPADENANNIPDLVEKCAAYCDTSHNVHTALGYLPPPPDGVEGGDSTYDVYFTNTSLYGFVQPGVAGPEAWDDWTSYLVLNESFEGFPENSDPEGSVAGAAKATCAHELHQRARVTSRRTAGVLRISAFMVSGARCYVYRGPGV